LFSIHQTDKIAAGGMNAVLSLTTIDKFLLLLRVKKIPKKSKEPEHQENWGGKKRGGTSTGQIG